MSLRRPGFEGRYIVVADEDRTIANEIIEVLTADGHAVFLAYDGLSALELAFGLKVCDLVISNSRVGGMKRHISDARYCCGISRSLASSAILFCA